MALESRIALSDTVADDRTIGATVGTVSVYEVFVTVPTADRILTISNSGTKFLVLTG